jgi:hypothetical protein
VSREFRNVSNSVIVVFGSYYGVSVGGGVELDEPGVVGVALSVGVLDEVGVGVALSVGVLDEVGVGVEVGVEEGVGLSVNVGVREGVELSVIVGLG